MEKGEGREERWESGGEEEKEEENQEGTGIMSSISKN